MAIFFLTKLTIPLCWTSLGCPCLWPFSGISPCCLSSRRRRWRYHPCRPTCNAAKTFSTRHVQLSFVSLSSLQAGQLTHNSGPFLSAPSKCLALLEGSSSTDGLSKIDDVTYQAIRLNLPSSLKGHGHPSYHASLLMLAIELVYIELVERMRHMSGYF